MIIKYTIHCNTESSDKNWYLSDSDPAPRTCPTNTAHDVDPSSLVVVQIGGPQEFVQVLGKDNLTLDPRGMYFEAPVGINPFDMQLDGTVVLRGAYMYSPNATMGDFISIEIVDKDDVLGMGATPDSPVVLGQYCKKWMVFPTVINHSEDISISDTLPQGLYVRVLYTNTGTETCKVAINFISYDTGT